MLDYCRDVCEDLLDADADLVDLEAACPVFLDVLDEIVEVEELSSKEV